MFFGGIIATLIPDNTKAMINDPDALEPTLVAAFLDYVQARGVFVDPARIRSPKDKPRVENQVPFVRESWFDGETFSSLDDARESAARWCSETPRIATPRGGSRCSMTSFDAQSAVDRFKNTAYDFVIEGESYRARLKPTIDASSSIPDAPAMKQKLHPRARARRRR
jgi:hypothetical protein